MGDCLKMNWQERVGGDWAWAGSDGVKGEGGSSGFVEGSLSR